MTEQGVLVLVGAEALQLKDRLEASGYTALVWGAGDRAIASDGQQPMAALVSPGQLPQVGDLQLESATCLVCPGRGYCLNNGVPFLKSS